MEITTMWTMMIITVIICAKMWAYDDTFDMDSSSDTVIDLNIVLPLITLKKALIYSEDINVFWSKIK